MDQSDIERILAWLVESGLGGVEENELLHGFCDRCRGAAVDLSRAIVLVDTLHPIYEGRAFRWRNDGVKSSVLEYGRTGAGERRRTAAQRVHYLLTTGADRFDGGSDAAIRRISCLDRLRAAETDCVPSSSGSATAASSEKWTASTRTGRRAGRAAFAMRSSRRCGSSCRRWR
jgi:adenylate cyclase